MTEREEQAEDQGDAAGQGDESTDEWVREVEEDPSTAGSPEEPGEELRGG
jgi:hypothetical protein